MRVRRWPFTLLLLLLLGPHAGRASLVGSGVAAANAAREAERIPIAEDYRRWAGTVASAMLLRAGNDQAAGEGELDRLQAHTNKLLDDWQNGILPPQVRFFKLKELGRAVCPSLLASTLWRGLLPATCAACPGNSITEQPASTCEDH